MTAKKAKQKVAVDPHVSELAAAVGSDIGILRSQIRDMAEAVNHNADAANENVGHMLDWAATVEERLDDLEQLVEQIDRVLADHLTPKPTRWDKALAYLKRKKESLSW